MPRPLYPAYGNHTCWQHSRTIPFFSDGSDDEHAFVGEYCQSLAKDDSRIVYKKLEKNEGISENTNVCIKMASGEYIALFDHDDVLHPSALFEVMKAICEQGAEYVYTDEVTFVGEDLNDIVTYHFKPDFAIDNLLANNYICHFSVFKASLLDKVGVFRSKYDYKKLEKELDKKIKRTPTDHPGYDG